MPEVPGWEGRFFEDFAVGDVYVHRLGRCLLITSLDVSYAVCRSRWSPYH